MSAHPAAAKLGQKVWRSMGGEEAMTYGNQLAAKLFRRKTVLQKKMGKGIGGRKVEKKRLPAAQPKPVKQHAGGVQWRAADEKRREKGAETIGMARSKALKEKLRLASEEAAAESRRTKAEARKAEGARPSLFVVSLHYLAPLARIDAAMDGHNAFLDKYLAAGNFLVAGRVVPRTGGIILAHGMSRNGVERLMRQDPFVKGKLASMTIVEFKGARVGDAMAGVLNTRIF